MQPDHDLEYDPAGDAAWAALPGPEVMPYRTMLEEFEVVNVLAPLVRCSKLPFRHLVSLYETHVTHTPMILAEEFSRSQQARVADFTTAADERGVFWMEPKVRRGVNYELKERGEMGGAARRHATGKGEEVEDVADARERKRGEEEDEEELAECTRALALDTDPRAAYPSKSYHSPRLHARLPPTLIPPTPRSRLVRGRLIAQLASPNGPSLADAAELLAPHVDGVDINCGCPQRWAYNEGIGCALLRKPEVVADMIRRTHDRLGWDWPVSIKIRVDDARATQTLVDNALAMGVSHITIHGRTRHQASTEPVCLDSIARAVDMVRGRVPTVANGDLWELEDAERMRATRVDGVMAARGLLANPALFAGYKRTPLHAVENFVNLSLDYGFIFSLFHRHASYMLESAFYKPEKTYFNALASSAQVVEYLRERGVRPAERRRMKMWDARRGYTLL